MDWIRSDHTGDLQRDLPGEFKVLFTGSVIQGVLCGLCCVLHGVGGSGVAAGGCGEAVLRIKIKLIDYYTIFDKKMQAI